MATFFTCIPQKFGRFSLWNYTPVTSNFIHLKKKRTEKKSAGVQWGVYRKLKRKKYFSCRRHLNSFFRYVELYSNNKELLKCPM